MRVVVVHRLDKQKEGLEIAEEVSKKLTVVGVFTLEEFTPIDSDLVIAVGGDGTVLRIAKCSEKPIVGFNAGRVGFLTSYHLRNADVFLEDIDRNNLTTEKLWMLKAVTTNDSHDIVNDVVVHRSMTEGMIELDVTLDSCSALHFFADGLVFSTPTGSTAYNLALGGAIVSPCCDVFQMIPIAPYFFQNRSVIAPLTRRALVESPKGFEIFVDGAHVGRDNHLEVMKSSRYFTLLRPKNYDFFNVLKSKVGYGRGLR